MCPPRTNSSNPGCRRRPSLPYSDRLGGEKAISCQIKSSQVKSSQVKTLPVKSIKSSQISTTDRTHARTGPETQRAQAHNHTQNSNQVCMSLRSRRLHVYRYMSICMSPAFSPPIPPIRSRFAGPGGRRMRIGYLLVGTSLGARLGRSPGAGLRGPGRVATLEPLSTTLHGRAPVHGVPVPVQMPGRTCFD